MVFTSESSPFFKNNLSTSRRNGAISTERMIKYRRLRPYKTAEIKVLLLENVNQAAIDLFTEAGYQVTINCVG